MDTKQKLNFLKKIIIYILVIVGIYFGFIFIIDCLNSQGFIKKYFSTFYQDAVKQSISVFGSILTIGTTWLIYLLDSKRYREKEIELRYMESRPFFHLKNIDGTNIINFKSLKQDGILLLNVKILYFGFNQRVLGVDELYNISCDKNDIGINNYIILNQDNYFLSQFIALKATTIYNESVYFINDCFEQRGYNFIKEVNKSSYVQFKNFNGDILGEEMFNDTFNLMIKYLDGSYSSKMYRDTTLSGNVKYTMIKLQECDINDVSLVITLIRNYKEDIKYEEVISLLRSVKNILICTEEVEVKKVSAEEYGYFIGNLICTNNFRDKYSKIFRSAKLNKTDCRQIMIDYLNDYINEYINANLRGEEIDKDFPLRNLEVYISYYVKSNSKFDNTEIMNHMKNILERLEREKK